VALSYRAILAIMGGVTLMASAYIVTMLRHHIAADIRRPAAEAPTPVTPEPTLGVVADASILPTAPVEP
jgi:hypothetical protein